MMQRCIYLDNSATTPLSDAARKALTEAMDCFGNPSSLHELGRRSEKLIDSAREQVLSALGARRGQGTVIFTSCGTEATSLALFGSAYAKTRRDAVRILTTDSEHSATLRALERLEKEGFEIVRIPTVGGVLDADALDAALDKKIFLASFMLVNNETGALYDVKSAFAKIKRAYPDAITHCDAIQGFLRVQFSPATLGADLISVSGHKVHAPKGVGALYVSADMIKAKKIVTILPGGGQERGFRSGTENILGIAAFGAACADMAAKAPQNREHLAQIYAYATEKLAQLGVRVNTPRASRVDHIVNITLPDIKSETMLHHLSADGIFVSSGSACSSHSSAPSTALMAFGLSAHEADCSLRISFSPYSTSQQIDALIESMGAGLERLVRIKR